VVFIVFAAVNKRIHSATNRPI